MYDPLSDALRAVGAGTNAAFPLVFVAGVASSVGPCAAPRLIAISGVTAHQDARQIRRTTAAFVAGLATAYGSLGMFASAIASLVSASRYMYFAMAIGLLAGGILTLTQGTGLACSNDRARRPAPTAGGAFLLGGSFALVISPCCTPIVMAIMLYCAQIHSVAFAVGLLMMFALGHAAPVIGIALGIHATKGFTSRVEANEALRVVSGALMLSLCAYYLCLA